MFGSSCYCKSPYTDGWMPNEVCVRILWLLLLNICWCVWRCAIANFFHAIGKCSKPSKKLKGSINIPIPDLFCMMFFMVNPWQLGIKPAKAPIYFDDFPIEIADFPCNLPRWQLQRRRPWPIWLTQAVQLAAGQRQWRCSKNIDGAWASANPMN